MLDPSYWLGLAADYATAYAQAFGRPGSKKALVLSMSVAEHETNNGRAWPGSNNFGAVQLRALTPEENAAFHAGKLKAGDYTPSRDGVLHVDTHPTPHGDQPYPIWFAAFPTRVAGVAWFLRTLWRLSSGTPDDDGATCATVAEAMYLHGYYEGAAQPDEALVRPVRMRADPLTPPEARKVAAYAGAMERCRAMIEPALASFMPDAAPSSTPAPGPGQEAGEAGVDESSASGDDAGLPGNAHSDVKAVAQ